MATLTQAAGEMLAQTLREKEASKGECIRLTTDGQQLKMVLSAERPDDTLLSHDDKVVLALAPELALQLEEATFDVKETAEGQKLVIR